MDSENHRDLDIDEWMSHCPFSPTIKRQKTSGYTAGGSWHGGRVELKVDRDLVDDDARQMIQRSILQAFQRLHQTIIGEGLFYRSHTKMVESPGFLAINAERQTEYLGDDGDASCGRIGSIIPILPGYTVYGRIDNIQVLVQDYVVFNNMMDELVDRKVSMLRRATVAFGKLERWRAEQKKEISDQYMTMLANFGERHQDELVARICEDRSAIGHKQVPWECLVQWEEEREIKSTTQKTENEKRLMDIEHEYYQNKVGIIRSCLI